MGSTACHARPIAGSGPGGSSGSGAPGGGPGGGGSPQRPPGGGGEDSEAAANQGELATEEELVEIARQLAAAPAEDVVANHCYGLFELAALHLSQQPPQLDKARLAIDALGLLVDGLGERLGQHAEGLVDGLSQLRIAFVKIAAARPGADGQDPGES